MIQSSFLGCLFSL
ncbi:unnamed protein product [Amaranthus hypochondriacus]